MVNAEINVLSPIFETQFGFHFLEVLDKRTEDITDITIEDRFIRSCLQKIDEERKTTRLCVQSFLSSKIYIENYSYSPVILLVLVPIISGFGK